MGSSVKNLATADEYERLFGRYLSVCNQALEKNKDRFPYREIWKARLESPWQSYSFDCAVYDDRPKLAYALQLTRDMRIIVTEKLWDEPLDAWPFAYSYLERVANNPQHFIDRPSDLDWGWLTHVFG
ncbi:MAG: hypothetical protein P4M13_06255 [Alphaproteobacteria bacterium]|nr:hypothetical protein [Alphaproteobacteria bacterium]